MNALDLLLVVVEGAVDRFCGRPRTANPYSFESVRDGHEAWLMAWDETDLLLEMRGAEEAARWLAAA
jgi:hypothetical protein